MLEAVREELAAGRSGGGRGGRDGIDGDSVSEHAVVRPGEDSRRDHGWQIGVDRQRSCAVPVDPESLSQDVRIGERGPGADGQGTHRHRPEGRVVVSELHRNVPPGPVGQREGGLVGVRTTPGLGVVAVDDRGDDEAIRGGRGLSRPKARRAGLGRERPAQDGRRVLAHPVDDGGQGQDGPRALRHRGQHGSGRDRLSLEDLVVVHLHLGVGRERQALGEQGRAVRAVRDEGDRSALSVRLGEDDVRAIRRVRDEAAEEVVAASRGPHAPLHHGKLESVVPARAARRIDGRVGADLSDLSRADLERPGDVALWGVAEELGEGVRQREDVAPRDRDAGLEDPGTVVAVDRGIPAAGVRREVEVGRDRVDPDVREEEAGNERNLAAVLDEIRRDGRRHQVGEIDRRQGRPRRARASGGVVEVLELDAGGQPFLGPERHEGISRVDAAGLPLDPLRLHADRPRLARLQGGAVPAGGRNEPPVWAGFGREPEVGGSRVGDPDRHRGRIGRRLRRLEGGEVGADDGGERLRRGEDPRARLRCRSDREVHEGPREGLRLSPARRLDRQEPLVRSGRVAEAPVELHGERLRLPGIEQDDAGVGEGEERRADRAEVTRERLAADVPDVELRGARGVVRRPDEGRGLGREDDDGGSIDDRDGSGGGGGADGSATLDAPDPVIQQAEDVRLQRGGRGGDPELFDVRQEADVRGALHDVATVRIQADGGLPGKDVGLALRRREVRVESDLWSARRRALRGGCVREHGQKTDAGDRKGKAPSGHFSLPEWRSLDYPRASSPWGAPVRSTA